ncbi:MAG: coproporphyrinogen dehydrogenase HemZ, partial [Clostridia bacterium]
YYLYRQKYMAGNLENVGYAKPGRACLYNIGNMEETAKVLALGAGAITKWLFPAERRIERAANVKNIEAYIERVDEMLARKRALLIREDEEK